MIYSSTNRIIQPMVGPKDRRNMVLCPQTLPKFWQQLKGKQNLSNTNYFKFWQIAKPFPKLT